MSPRQRCEEILRLIDDTLADSTEADETERQDADDQA